MAVQGKGILGIPKGVIGSINCITRYGQGIIQSRATINEPYSRYFNLLKSSFSKRLVFYWNFISASQKAVWNLAAPSGSTGFQYFSSLAIERARLNKRSNLCGALWIDTPSFKSAKGSIINKWQERQLILTLEEDSLVWSYGADINIFILFKSTTLPQRTLSVTYPFNLYKPFVIKIPISVNSLYSVAVYRASVPSISKFFDWSLLDGFNPSYDFNT